MAKTKSMKAIYHTHRSNAKGRGVRFLLTFDEWKAIWLDSGKWEQRGCHRGEFVMARHGDQGAYESGNVRICSVSENHDERVMPPRYGAANPAFGKNYWLNAPQSRRDAVSRQFKGRPKRLETRLAMRAAATGRKRVYRNGLPTWAYAGDPDFPGAQP